MLWLLSTSNASSVTEELKFTFYSILINVRNHTRPVATYSAALRRLYSEDLLFRYYIIKA